MLVNEVMQENVFTIARKKTVREAANLMKAEDTDYLIVIEGKAKLVGILTESDIIKRVVASGKDTGKTGVDEVMTKQVVMVNATTDLTDAAELMAERHIKRLPVLQGSSLIGIVSATNLCLVEPKLAERVGKLLAIPRQKKIIAG